MKPWLCAVGSAALTAIMVAGPVVEAQPRTPGLGLQDAVERTCVIELRSGANGERIQLQNICFNPRAVRIAWGDGRLIDYCLNSGGDVRYVVKLSDDYRLTREQDILLCQ
ncbi:hypothetical protein AncyloWKF20_08845 [Ancylobacter sp. WKF20]|uniref:hypothetical protein n=1 Tax=Ancylobacter sp. WKF20 TaxID=3039801 RepID=UPI0024341A0E|nr:hypothetical protein [Ancylobacter sp. WKF20]WGD31910.1 hypothetical protein AncyloWKF20_08845 [Ancylobacter sp. WKF20]